MESKLKLFVWEEFCTDYTDGLAFAIAETEEEARKLVIKALFDPYDWGVLTVYDLNTSRAFAVAGGS